jgi:hypothetical protein
MMLPRLIAALLALLMVRTAALGADWLTDIHALAHTPRAYYTKTITVEGMQCIDASQGFQCVKEAGNRLVRVDAPFMGSSTRQDVIERFEAQCKGTASLMRPECKMTAVFAPVTHEEKTIDSAQGKETLIVFIANGIDFQIPE